MEFMEDLLQMALVWFNRICLHWCSTVPSIICYFLEHSIECGSRLPSNSFLNFVFFLSKLNANVGFKLLTFTPTVTCSTAWIATCPKTPFTFLSLPSPALLTANIHMWSTEIEAIQLELCFIHLSDLYHHVLYLQKLLHDPAVHSCCLHIAPFARLAWFDRSRKGFKHFDGFLDRPAFKVIRLSVEMKVARYPN